MEPLTLRVVTAELAVLLLLLTAGMVIGRPERAEAWDNGVATTPPMGWNSYDSYNWNVTEAQVQGERRLHARQPAPVRLAVHRHRLGLVLPGQRHRQPEPGREPATRGCGWTPTAACCRTPRGSRRPTGSNGFKPLADYIHAAGLKFGVHLMRGIPRQAVADNVPILGHELPRQPDQQHHHGVLAEPQCGA